MTYYGKRLHKIPWTRRQLLIRMNKAGWKRVSSASATYAHTSGGQIHIDEFVNGAPRWKAFTERNELPNSSEVYGIS